MKLWEILQLERSLLQSFQQDDFVRSIAEVDRDRIRIFLGPMATKQTTVAKGLKALTLQELKIASKALDMIKKLKEFDIDNRLVQTHHDKASAEKQMIIERELERVTKLDLSSVEGMSEGLGLFYGEIVKRQDSYSDWINMTLALANSFDAEAKATFAELARCLSEVSLDVKTVLDTVVGPILAFYEEEQLRDIGTLVDVYKENGEL